MHKSSSVAGAARSQTVGSLLSAYDDDSHDEVEPETWKEDVPKIVPKVVPIAVESRSWSNWEDMSLCRFINFLLFKSFFKGVSRVIICHNQEWLGLSFPVALLGKNAMRLDPRRRHGIIMGKQPEELIAAWPREDSAYPAGHPPAVPPGCCSQSCQCMDGTKRHGWSTPMRRKENMRD